MLKQLLAVLGILLPVLATAAMPMGFDEARHLLNRTSFAANFDGIGKFARLTRAQAVDQLLAWPVNLNVGTPAPARVNEFESPRGVRGGLYGLTPALNRLDGNGNLPFAVDFRDLCATALDRWWGVNATSALSGRFNPVNLLRA